MSAKSAKGKKEWGLYVKVTLGVLCVLVGAAGFKIYEDVLASNINLPGADTGYLYLRSGKSFNENFESLKESKLMRNADAFSRLVKLFNYDEKLKPGRYKVDGTMSNLSLIRMMAAGRQEPVDIVFKYAERKSDLAAFWGKQLEADSNEIIALLNDRQLLDSMGLDTASAVSMFIPNTYNFYWTTSAPKLVKRMAEEYRKFWDSARIEKSEALGLLPAQVSTLASIVQKETYRKEEMPTVAGVYYNRLKKKMPFQADPTIIYAMNDRSIKRVGGKMLSVESPYNTYRYAGLIPGPICVPSPTAIDAVLNMKKHNYIYFCAKEDFSGYHNFSATFSQHQVYAARYQRMLNKRGILK